MRIQRLVILGLALCTLALGLPSIRLYLTGSVRFNDQQEAPTVEGLYLFVKADGRIVTSTHVDAAGKYAISFIPEQQPSFDFYYAGLGHDTTFIKSFTKFESDVMKWDFEL